MKSISRYEYRWTDVIGKGSKSTVYAGKLTTIQALISRREKESQSNIFTLATLTSYLYGCYRTKSGY